MDNCTPEKVAFLGRIGFEQVVLARELTLEEIREIAVHAPNMTLEAFVHGALYVSYSSTVVRNHPRFYRHGCFRGFSGSSTRGSGPADRDEGDDAFLHRDIGVGCHLRCRGQHGGCRALYVGDIRIQRYL